METSKTHSWPWADPKFCPQDQAQRGISINLLPGRRGQVTLWAEILGPWHSHSHPIFCDWGFEHDLSAKCPTPNHLLSTSKVPPPPLPSVTSPPHPTPTYTGGEARGGSAARSDLLQRLTQQGQGERSSQRETDTQSHSPEAQEGTNHARHLQSQCPGYELVRTALFLPRPCSPDTEPKSHPEKTSRPTQTVKQSTKNLWSTPQKFQGY